MSDSELKDPRLTDEEACLAERLREARDYLGLSQEFVADHLGIPRASVSAIETGRRKVNSLELKRMASLYKTSIAVLLGEDDPAEHETAQDPTFQALFRAARELSDQDREQVVRFARFLRHAGRAPSPLEVESASLQPAT